MEKDSYVCVSEQKAVIHVDIKSKTSGNHPVILFERNVKILNLKSMKSSSKELPVKIYPPSAKGTRDM